MELALRGLSTMAVEVFGSGARLPLKRLNTLKPEAQTLVGAHSAGVTSLTATATQLRGRAVKGSTFTVAGVTGTYAASADASAGVNNQVTVTFTPALAGPALNGAAVTWSQPYAEHSFLRMKGAREEDTDDQVGKGTQVFHLAYDAALPAPDPGDFLGGLRIKSAETVGENLRYRVVVEGAR